MSHFLSDAASDEKCDTSGEERGTQASPCRSHDDVTLGVSPCHMDAPLRLSPSQIEVYLECPYKWFATRMLGLRTPDEDFGPREQGDFVHEALRRLFTRLGRKVTADDESLASAAAVAEEVVAELLAEQAQPGRAGRRLAALPGSNIEQSQVAQLREDVLSVVFHEPVFLQGTSFEPAAFEFSFSDLDVRWGGCRLGGTIDRGDLDADGNAIIVDYKGSLSSAYDLPKAKAYADRGLAGRKVQALLYMAALSASPELRAALSTACGRRVKGVVGALYLSYKHAPGKLRVRGTIARELEDPRLCLPTASSAMPCYPLVGDGACDKGTLLMSHFPGDAASGAGKDDDGPSLAQVLADLEETVRTRVVGGIEAGRVERVPSGKEACAFCPVAACERRLS